MEKFGLVDKTKDELIDIALEKDASEKLLREELYHTNSNLAHAEIVLKSREKAICMLCIICMILMALTTFLVFMDPIVRMERLF